MGEDDFDLGADKKTPRARVASVAKVKRRHAVAGVLVSVGVTGLTAQLDKSIPVKYLGGLINPRVLIDCVIGDGNHVVGLQLDVVGEREGFHHNTGVGNYRMSMPSITLS